MKLNSKSKFARYFLLINRASEAPKTACGLAWRMLGCFLFWSMILFTGFWLTVGTAVLWYTLFTQGFSMEFINTLEPIYVVGGTAGSVLAILGILWYPITKVCNNLERKYWEKVEAEQQARWEAEDAGIPYVEPEPNKVVQFFSAMYARIKDKTCVLIDWT